MNTIAPVSQFQPSNDASQFKSSESSDPSGEGAGSLDFTSAMQAAGSKPARKSSATKSSQSNQNGNSSPGGGNQSPSALPPGSPPAGTAVNGANGANGAASAVSTAPASAPAVPSLPAAAAQLAAPLPAAGAPSPVTPGAVTPSATTPGAFAQMIDSPDSGASATSGAKTASATGDTPPLVLPAGAEVTKAALPLAAAAISQSKIGAGAAAAAAIDESAATHAARLNPGDPSSGTIHAASAANAAAGGETISATDAAAQDTMAAAAAAQAANSASSGDKSAHTFLGASDSSTNAGAAPSTTVMPQVAVASPGAAGSHGIATSATAGAASAAAASAAAASTARAITALAGVGGDAAGRPSHPLSADASAPGVTGDGGAGAAQWLSATTAGTNDTSTGPTFKVDAPVETNDFSQGVADRVSFMVDGNIGTAKLQVNPPALGPIEVRIALQGAHAQVSFTSHSALTRDALESSAPKLREMLGSQGFGQVSVDVSQGGSSQDRATQTSAYQASAAGARDLSIDAAPSPTRTGSRVATGVLDAYA